MNLQMKRLRKEKGFTQKTLAGVIEFDDGSKATEKQIWSWEQGKTFPLEYAVLVADALDCSLDELAGRHEFINRYADKRQSHINTCYMRLEEPQKETVLKMMEGLAELPYTQAETAAVCDTPISVAVA